MVQKLGKGALLAKADIQSAFRLLRIWPGDFDQLGFSLSGNFYFDKCLPMGVAVSCSLFEKCSSALHWYTEFCSQNNTIIHYPDSLQRFRREYGFPDSWPVPLDQSINFVAYLSFTGLSPASLTTYISGIGYAHKA
jgi:hypothetical protein